MLESGIQIPMKRLGLAKDLAIPPVTTYRVKMLYNIGATRQQCPHAFPRFVAWKPVASQRGTNLYRLWLQQGNVDVFYLCPSFFLPLSL